MNLDIIDRQVGKDGNVNFYFYIYDKSTRQASERVKMNLLSLEAGITTSAALSKSPCSSTKSKSASGYSLAAKK